jgi:hypothetical protein
VEPKFVENLDHLLIGGFKTVFSTLLRSLGEVSVRLKASTYSGQQEDGDKQPASPGFEPTIPVSKPSKPTP